MLNCFFIKIKLHAIVFCFLLSMVYTKNLTLHDYDNPSANHILDIEVINNLLIVPGFLGGIEFYDISNPAVLNHLDTFTLSNGGQGGGSKPNCIKATINYAYLTSNKGLSILNITNPLNVQNLGYVNNTDNYILENLDIQGNLLAVAAHEDGVLIYDISNPENPQLLSIIESNNAWTVHIRDEYVFVGDESNLLVYNIFENSFILSYSMNLGNAIKDIVSDDNLLYVALGSNGVKMFSFPQDSEPVFLDSFDTSALANRLSTFNNKVAVSDWDDVEVLEYKEGSLQLVGFKNTTRRTMAIATKDDFIYSAEWASIQVFEYGQVGGPDIDLNTYELNYPFVQNGQSEVLSLVVSNNGNKVLLIEDAYTTNNEFLPLLLNDLLPGDSQTVEITYNANANNASGSYRIYTNDPDEPEIICETNGNIIGANVGDNAPEFNLPIIGNGSGNFQLSDHLGKVVVLAFFAPM